MSEFMYLLRSTGAELRLHTAPVLLGEGVRLFERADPRRFTVELAETIASPLVTHVRYEVRGR